MTLFELQQRLNDLVQFHGCCPHDEVYIRHIELTPPPVRAHSDAPDPCPPEPTLQARLLPPTSKIATHGGNRVILLLPS